MKEPDPLFTPLFSIPPLFFKNVLFEFCFRWSPNLDVIDMVDLQNQHYNGKPGPRPKSAGDEKNVGTVKEMPMIACESKYTQKNDSVLKET